MVLSKTASLPPIQGIFFSGRSTVERCVGRVLYKNEVHKGEGINLKTVNGKKKKTVLLNSGLLKTLLLYYIYAVHTTKTNTIIN
jgi:hypothetical protein